MAGNAIVDITISFGATFVGMLVVATLFGLTIAQTWIYFWNYHNRDSKELKLFIVFLTFIDVMQTIVIAYMNYWYLVLNFGNVDNLDISVWAFYAQIITSTIISTAVQLFYARRVYLVSQSIICPILIVICAAIGFVFGIYYTARAIIGMLFSDFYSLIWISCVALIAAALADVLIAASMCWYLYHKRTGFARTDSIILKLMAYSVHSGLLTCILGAAVAISNAAAPAASLSPLAILWVLSKCYVNSLLAILNTRDYVRDRSTTDNPDNAYSLSTFRIAPRSEVYGTKSGQPGVAVSVHHTTKTDFGGNKSDNDGEPTFAPQKADVPLRSQGQASESSV